MLTYPEKVIKRIRKVYKKFLRSQERVRTTSLVGLLLLITAIPLTVHMNQKQQDIRQRAEGLENCFYTEKYQEKPVINVKSFGAKGDGVADDREAIQNAINCFKNTSISGVIYIPSGTYQVSKRLYLPSNIIVFGDDLRAESTLQSNTILQLTTTKDHLFYNDNTTGHENITIRNITLKGLGIDDFDNDAERCCAGIEFHGLKGGLIKDVTVQGFNDNGIHFDRYISEEKGVQNVIIDGVIARGNKRSGIAINNGVGNIIHNSVIKENNKGENADSWSTSKRDAALILELGKRGVISDNKLIGNYVASNGWELKNSGGGIAVRSDIRSSERVLQNNAVCKNTVENNADVGIAEANGTGNVYIANVIRNNKDRNDGKIVICDKDENGCQNHNNNAYEDESPNATHALCDISQKLATIPSLPPKASVITGGTPIVSGRPTATTTPVSPTVGASPTPGNGTPTITPTGSATSPTPTPTQTPIPTQTPTPTLTPTPTMPKTPTQISLTLILPGIGKNGNQNPNNQTREVIFQLFDKNGDKVGSDVIGDIAYDESSGTYKGIINMGTIVKSDTYVPWIKSHRFLRGLGGKQTPITAGVTNTLPQITLIAGDINSDEKIDVLDFNIIASCFLIKSESEICEGKKVDADINDDGIVDGIDYNLFLGGIKTTKQK